MPAESTSVSLYIVRSLYKGATMTNESGGQTIEIVEFIQKALPILGAMVVCVVIIVFLVIQRLFVVVFSVYSDFFF